MYQKFFSLKQQPFSIVPDPDFLFFTEQHKEALAHLTYGLQGNGGFVVLTGEVGTGKTTICQFLLQDMPSDTDIASITTPAISEIALLVDICEQFSIEYDHENISLKVMFDALTSWMLVNHQRGRHAIVLIDEAQHLTFNMLEQLRLLTNIESDNKKPLQIILVGQTELQKKLLTKELRQLSQRITARYHLRPLDKQETNFYIYHRLHRSGAQGPIFEPQAIPAIFKASRGIPRLINQICDRCLLSAYTQSSLVISASIAKKSIFEAELPKRESLFKPYIPYLISITSVILIVFIINTQATVISGYFKKSEKETMQQEWLRVIDSAQNQQNIGKQSTVLTIDEQLTSLTPSGTLLAMPSLSYTLQLAALPNAKSVRRFFIKNSQLQGKTYLYQRKSTTSQYVILLGSFNTYKMAKLASKELKKRFPKISPWIKDYKTIHSDLKT
ncbi:AAA family ATPase [Psychromonas hadalis]|uniref:AAA family ATPase n=1 Tax=Psychromonas hadalis TaxID=211669 RepID=UPI0003B56AF8|nr:AAA family ATPase [Psychromonas hadalis]